MLNKSSGGGILPAGYTAVDYLESSGTQYIDTGISPNEQTGIYIQVSRQDVSTDRYLLGCRENNNTDTRWYLGIANSRPYYGLGAGTNRISTGTVTNGTPFVTSVNYRNDNTFVVNIHSNALTYRLTLPVTRHIVLFGYHRPDGNSCTCG